MFEETKYKTLLNIFSHFPYTLSSSPTYSASTLSRFLSSSDFTSIADTTLLRKTGSKFEGVKKLYDPSLKRTLFAHRALVIVLSAGDVKVPVHIEIIQDIKPKNIDNCNKKKLNVGGSFNDYTPERFEKDLKD